MPPVKYGIDTANLKPGYRYKFKYRGTSSRPEFLTGTFLGLNESGDVQISGRNNKHPKDFGTATLNAKSIAQVFPA